MLVQDAPVCQKYDGVRSAKTIGVNRKRFDIKDCVEWGIEDTCFCCLHCGQRLTYSVASLRPRCSTMRTRCTRRLPARSSSPVIGLLSTRTRFATWKKHP